MKLLELLKKQAFGIAIVLSAVSAFLWPNLYLEWFGVKLMPLVGPIIMVIMFGMGTTLSLKDFIGVVKAPWSVATGVVLQFLVMPIVGLLVAKAFGFEGELAAGTVLIGSVAGGTASNVIAYLAHANVALSVTMTCISTLLSPFVTPLLMKALAGQYVEINTVKMMIEMLKIVLFPVIAGSLVHAAFRKQFDSHKTACDRVLSLVSMTAICFSLVVILAPSHDKLIEAGVVLFVAAIIHNSVGYLAGFWLSRLLGKFLPIGEKDARTIAIEVGMQNGGMASALAVNVLHSAVSALPPNVFSIWMNFSGSILANYWNKRPCKT